MRGIDPFICPLRRGAAVVGVTKVVRIEYGIADDQHTAFRRFFQDGFLHVHI